LRIPHLFSSPLLQPYLNLAESVCFQHVATTTTPSKSLTIIDSPHVPSSFCLVALVLSLYQPGGGKVQRTFEVGMRQP